MKLRLLLVTLGCATFLAGARADAATTSYAGSSCHQLITPGATSILYDGGLARNQATSAKWFGCPAVQQGGRILNATVTVRDLSPVAGFTCYAINSNVDGLGGYQTASGTTSVAGGGAFTINLGGLLPSQFVPGGSKSIVCQVPANGSFDGSAVSTYSFQEE